MEEAQDQGKAPFTPRNCFGRYGWGFLHLCGGGRQIFSGHTNLRSGRLVFFNVKDLMEGGKNIKGRHALQCALLHQPRPSISGGNTAGIIDELHVFPLHPLAVSYIRNAMKRVRKRDSMVVLASQNISDFLLPGWLR